MFDAVTDNLPTALPKGQVIARGVALLDGNVDPLMPMTFAIVDGTGAYEGSRGQVIQSGPDDSIRTLNIVLRISNVVVLVVVGAGCRADRGSPRRPTPRQLMKGADETH